MNDTTPRAEALFRDLMMRRSGTERLRMGASMFSAAREMMVAGIRDAFPGIDERELRVQLLLRTYGQDLAPATLERVLARIRGR